VRPYVRLVRLALLGSFVAPYLTCFSSRAMIQRPALSVSMMLMIFLGAICIFGVLALLARLTPIIESAAERQFQFLLHLPDGYVDFAILISAAASLFLELAMIRWQASVYEVLAFYTNYSLLGCFAGLGVGYALGNRKWLPLFLTVPLLGWQFALLLGLRYGLADADRISLKFVPFSEQLNMGLPTAVNAGFGLATNYLLALIFLLTALAFLPIGQLCGCLLERREKLSGYSINLIGSVLGILLMFCLSAVWTPPIIWFLLAFTSLLLFHEWNVRVLVFGLSSAVLSILILAWPVNPGWQRIYSPYQLLEVGPDRHGLTLITAAGHIYQRVTDLARSNRNVDLDPELSKTRSYYEFPYQLYGHVPGSVVVVGAGTGNDVAAALRNGAQKIDAVEIDPAILMEGTVAHPEHPYSDPRVHLVIDDARIFLRTTSEHYDLVVYGLLDSHTLLSQASSVRLDSFVYTVEGLREARSRLREDGILSLSFYVISPQLGRKLYLMLQSAFDGRPPLCVQAGHDGTVIFLEANHRNMSVAPALLQQSGFSDRTDFYSSPSLTADVSTDDWPFFYMPRRIYPASYLLMFAIILALSIFILSRFLELRPQSKHAPFFFLGAGFMLIETKAITELGLLFGNSWQVIGIVIVAILFMAFLANWIVQRFAIRRTLVLYSFLLLSIAIGWWMPRGGNFSFSWPGRIGLVILLTCPVFFSGIVFSTLLRSRGQISNILGLNLLGAMCGGLMEYNSMYFGFRFLYVLAGCLYLLAYLSGLRPCQKEQLTRIREVSADFLEELKRTCL
jgi:SAM-dependent methyltransferase